MKESILDNLEKAEFLDVSKGREASCFGGEDCFCDGLAPNNISVKEYKCFGGEDCFCDDGAYETKKSEVYEMK